MMMSVQQSSRRRYLGPGKPDKQWYVVIRMTTWIGPDLGLVHYIWHFCLFLSVPFTRQGSSSALLSVSRLDQNLVRWPIVLRWVLAANSLPSWRHASSDACVAVYRAQSPPTCRYAHTTPSHSAELGRRGYNHHGGWIKFLQTRQNAHEIC